VNCTEFLHLVTPAVDDRLTAGEREDVLAHAAACPGCRMRLESERQIANLVRQRVPRVAVPAHLMSRIAQSIAHEEAEHGVTFLDALQNVWHSIYFRPAVGFVFAAAAVIFFVSGPAPHQQSTPSPLAQASTNPVPPSKNNDLVDQSVKNYNGALKGTLPSDAASNHPEQVTSYFKGRSKFPVVVPNMENLTLVGYGMNDVQGKPMAHIVFRHGNDTIALTQTDTVSVLNGNDLTLSAAVREQLARTGWYHEVTPDGRSVMLWINGGTLCVAVSRAECDTVLSKMAQGNDGAGR
jgi:hypothetical protein